MNRERPYLRPLQLWLVVMVAFVRTHAGDEENDAQWWSLRPLSKPPIPQVQGKSFANPIDAFITEKLQGQEINSSPQAERQTLIRRLYFDLIGLPPTPEEVERFEMDEDPGAYERLVDELLASPRYGERWARHWLDVVHYGDTHGYDKDQPRPHAWPYRDYVIRSFNEDKPYARFIQEQIAGDVLFPHMADGIEALGFISAGPWDLIGHMEVPESKTDGKIARHLDRDDMVSNAMSTFTSMTVHCAACHDHKFDPITSEDYYSLQAVFAAVDRTTRAYYDEPGLNRKLETLRARERNLKDREEELQKKIAELAGLEYGELKEKIKRARKAPGEATAPEFGYHSAIASSSESVKWVQVDLGHNVELEKIVLAPCWDDFAGIGAGFGFPARFKIEVSNNAEFEGEVTCIHDATGADVKNPGIVPQVIGARGIEGRFVRMTATKLAHRQDDYIFALAELEVYDSAGKNIARGGTVTALDSIEAPVRWRKQNLVDGIYPGKHRPNADDLNRRLAEIVREQVDAPTLAEWTATTNQLAQVQEELAGMPPVKKVYVGAVHHGSGAFRGTGPDGGQPRTIHLLARGDVRMPQGEVGPGALSVLSQLPVRFDLPADHEEGERRKALALWLSDPRNPLTWRSIVNRVWLYHFGRGLVDTPNDFGRMGEKPSHPELLDWLAAEFRDGSQSFKELHRLMVTSAAYKQVSTVTPAHERAAELDEENKLLWRMNRRKMEAEAVRDSILFVSGKLDLQMFGPGYQDFIIEKPEHSPHYQYHLHDPDDPRTHRRSIYRFIVRSQPQPFMSTLDCADPSMMVARRSESLSALQALALLNNGFVVAMAEHFAGRVGESGSREDQMKRAFALALSRPPDAEEFASLSAFAEEHGMANACRAIFNLNEFNFVD